MKFKFRKYIYFKLVFSFFCVIFTTMILSFLITSKFHFDDVKSNLKHDLNSAITNNFNLFLTGNSEMIKDSLNMTFYPITAISIYDKTGLLFETTKSNTKMNINPKLIDSVLSSKKDTTQNLGTSFFIPLEKPLGFYLEDKGNSYAIFVTVTNMKEMIKINKWLLLNILFVLTSGLFGYMIIAKSIVKPIKNLTKGSKDVINGNYEFQLPNKRDDEIGELTNTFNYMLIELNKTDKMRNEFVSNVSHEIKTPVTTIKGFSELLTYPNVSNSERIHYANVIKEEVTKITSLSDNLLKLASLDNSKANIDKKIFELDELIRRAILDLESLWTSKNLEFDLNLNYTLLNGDSKLLYHAFSNLIKNSIKFSNENSKIDISLHSDNSKIYFKIKDYGSGISKESLPRIFERFYKSDDSRNTEGTGLGLSIVQKVVLLHNGTISVSSIENKFTTFKIEFQK